jgi:cell division protease FtsH
MNGPMRDRRGQGQGPSKRPPQNGGPQRPMPPSRTFGFWIVAILMLFFGFQLLLSRPQTHQTITYTTFERQMERGNIAEITVIEGKEIEGRLATRQNLPLENGATQDVDRFRTELPFSDPGLLERIREQNPDAEVAGKSRGTNWMGVAFTYLPFVLILGIWLFVLRQMQSGGNRAFSFGKSKAKLVNADRPQVTFADVAGADEAKVDLEEIIEFLKSPRKFQRLGGRIPKGALLVGPPGTGKTLLAKAVAGEAGVPFFAMSGSDFVEMFVGVGASRVRDLFEQGKKHAPCLIFIDEIDAVGRHRGAGMGGGHDEREQTLNQLLVEMDGFETNEGVIILAATNRPDVLDPALLRPGRFDRQITVDMPDLIGREGILKVHMRRVNAAPDVDIKKIARGTPGMSGADLANLVNEGALLAARRNHEQVSMLDLEDAKERVMLGPERRARVMPVSERERTSYHECGHAIVAASIEGYDPVHKVSIIPRGQALGLTFTLPTEDRYQITRDDAENRIAVFLGGRAAEALIYPQVGAGAADDIKRASAYARLMVSSWGMSDRLGPIAFGQGEQPVFLGRDYHQQRNYSEQTAIAIDEEVHRIISNAYERAKTILEEKKDRLEVMAKALLERETLDGEDVQMILRGEELGPMGSAPEPQRASVNLGEEEGEKVGAEDEAGMKGRVTGEGPSPQVG